MIDRTHALPVTRQCRILSLARSTAYYRPQDASAADLEVHRPNQVFAADITYIPMKRGLRAMFLLLDELM
jgi:hypothetical protein